MRFAFFRANRGGLFDRIVSICSFSKYSHVEMIFSDDMSFSSTPWDNGVRFKKITYNDDWDFVNVTLNPKIENEIRAFCEKENHKKYDWIGAVGFVIHIRGDKKRWFCSEIIIEALQKSQLLKKMKSWKTNIEKLHNALLQFMPTHGQ